MLHIDAMQFDFIPGKDTMNATFIAHQLQEKNLEKKKEKLYLAFVDLEIAFDCVHREVVKSAMRKLVVDEWLIRTAIATYRNDNNVIRTNTNVADKFHVKVRIHQGFVLTCS